MLAGKGKARKGKEYARIGTVKSNAVCAAACAADAGKCVYYRLHRSRGCDLLEKPGDEINSGSFIGYAPLTIWWGLSRRKAPCNPPDMCSNYEARRFVVVENPVTRLVRQSMTRSSLS